MAEDAKTARVRRAAASGAERRQHERLPAERIQGLSLQITPGSDVLLHDISRGGARFQGEIRLVPGAWIDLRLITPEGIVTMRSKVVRSRLVRIGKGAMVYEAAVSFAELLPQATLAEASGAAAVASSTQGRPDDAPRVPAVSSTSAAGDDDGLPVMLLTACVRESLADLPEALNGNEW